MSFWRSRFSVRSERLGLAGMTSHPDRGQITEPGLRGGTFFAGGSAGGAFFGAGALLFLAVGRFTGGFLAVFVPFFATFFGTCLAGFLAADFFTTPFLVALRAGAAFFGAAVFWGGAIGNSHVGDGRRHSRQRAG